MQFKNASAKTRNNPLTKLAKQSITMNNFQKQTVLAIDTNVVHSTQ